MKRYPGHAVFGRVACSTGKAAKEHKHKTDSTGRSLSQERPYCKTGTAIDYGVGGFLEMRDTWDIRVVLVVIGWQEERWFAGYCSLGILLAVRRRMAAC